MHSPRAPTPSDAAGSATQTIAGFSFGSYVAFRVALQRECRQLLMVAPPVARFDFASAELPKAPWLVIQGDADDVVECDAVRHGF